MLPPSKPRMQLAQLFIQAERGNIRRKLTAICNRGGVARDEAVTAASNASEYAQNKFTFFKTPSDPDGTIAGLAATTNGQSFWVAQGPDALSAAWQYQNKAGVAVLQAKQPGTAAVIGTIREFPTLSAAQADADSGNIPAGSTAYYRSSEDSIMAVEVINTAGTLVQTGRVLVSKSYIDGRLPSSSRSRLYAGVFGADGTICIGGRKSDGKRKLPTALF